MRTVLAMLALLFYGCDIWWSTYIVTQPGSNDLAMTTSSDLGVPVCQALLTDGGTPTGCTSNAACAGGTPLCDLNTGTCVTSLPANQPFPAGNPFETTITLSKHYEVMATGDYNGDGLTDVAVTGVFTGPANATGASAAAVEIWVGDGTGGLRHDGNCTLPGTEAPVFLLTVQNMCSQQDLLVATFGTNVYRCTHSGSSWPASVIGNAGVNPGFKRLAVANDVGQATPDLIIQTTKNLFMETVDPATQGSVDVYRTGAGYTFDQNQGPSQASSTDINWVTPFRLKSGSGDTLALYWDDGTTVARRGIEFYYMDAGGAVNSQGYSSPVYVSGTFFPEFMKPFRATAVLHTPNQDPSLLVVLSQTPNFVAVLYGTSTPAFTVQASATLAQAGLVMPFAGDANSDGQDEIGLLSMALNATALTRHLQIISYKNTSINAMSPLTDISSTMDDFRAMSLAFLGATNDRRAVAKRKDLIALVDTPSGSASHILLRRANLNYQFP